MLKIMFFRNFNSEGNEANEAFFVEPIELDFLVDWSYSTKIGIFHRGIPESMVKLTWNKFWTSGQFAIRPTIEEGISNLLFVEYIEL